MQHAGWSDCGNCLCTLASEHNIYGVLSCAEPSYVLLLTTPSLQPVLSGLENKQKLLRQSHILKTAFIATADDSLPDDLVTTVQVRCHQHYTPVAPLYNTAAYT